MAQGNLGSPNINYGGNPWGNISEAITQGIQTHKDAIEHQQDRAVVQQQNQLAMQDAKLKAAQQKYQMLIPYALKNPKDPAINQAMDAVHRDLGVPTPRNADGSLDVETFKPKVDLNGEAWQKFISMNPSPAKSVAYKTLTDQFSGIPPEAATAEASMTPKEAATIANLQTRAKELGIKDNLAAKREANRELYTNIQMGMIGTRERLYQADTGKVLAEIPKITAEANAIPQRVAVLQQQANTAKQRADQMLTTGHVNRSMWNQNMSQMRDIQTQYHQMLGQRDNLERLQLQLQGQNIPDDDPKMTAINDQLSAVTASIKDMQPNVDSIDSYLQKNVNDLITNNTASMQSGKPSEVTHPGNSKALGKAPANVAPGFYNLHGHKIEVRSDGNYYSAP